MDNTIKGNVQVLYTTKYKGARQGGAHQMEVKFDQMDCGDGVTFPIVTAPVLRTTLDQFIDRGYYDPSVDRIEGMVVTVGDLNTYFTRRELEKAMNVDLAGFEKHLLTARRGDERSFLRAWVISR